MLMWAITSQGFGCMSLSPGFFGSKGVDEAESETTLRRALDLGVTVLNTADFYGGGSNIELIRWSFHILPHPLLDGLC